MKRIKTVEEQVKERIPRYEWQITSFFASPQELKEVFPSDLKNFEMFIKEFLLWLLKNMPKSMFRYW
jgi:hypothetical protein